MSDIFNDPRSEALRAANEAAATARDNIVEAHVAATLASGLMREGISSAEVVDRYREILAQLQKEGPYKGKLR